MEYTARTSQMIKLLVYLCICLAANIVGADKKGDNGASNESSTAKESKDLEKEETSWQRPSVNYGTQGWNTNKGWSNQGYGETFPSAGYGGYGNQGGFSGRYGHWNANYGNSKGWSNPSNANRQMYSGWSNYNQRDYNNYGREWPQIKSRNQGYASGNSYQSYYGNRWPSDRNIGTSKGYNGGYDSYGSGVYGNQYPVPDQWGGGYGNQKGYPTSRLWSDQRSYDRYPPQRFGDYERRFNNVYRQTRLPGNYKGTQMYGRGTMDNYWPATRMQGYNQGYQNVGWK